MSTFDPEVVLRRHLRAQVVPDPVTSVVDLVEGVLNGSIPAPKLRRRGRPGRRGFTIGVTVAVVAGGTLAATLVRREDVTQPHQGGLCRVAASVTAGGRQLGVSADPVAECRELWASGDMDRHRDNLDPTAPVDPAEVVVPPLVACISSAGLVDVYPATSCDDLDLVPADSTDIADAAADPLVALQERLSTEINAGCVAQEDTPPLIEQMLSDVGLDGWEIVLGRERPEDPCSIAVIVPDEQQIRVIRRMVLGPPPSPPTATRP